MRFLGVLSLAAAFLGCASTALSPGEPRSARSASLCRPAGGAAQFLPAGKLRDPGEVSDRLARRWGLQVCSWILLEGKEQEFEGGSPFIRGTFQLGADRGHPWGVELSAGYLSSENAQGGESSTSLVLLRARALYVLGDGRYCLSGGAELVYEDTEHVAMGLEPYWAGALDLGASVVLAERYEAGLSYVIFLGSENIPGALELSFGAMF